LKQTHTKSNNKKNRARHPTKRKKEKEKKKKRKNNNKNNNNKRNQKENNNKRPNNKRPNDHTPKSPCSSKSNNYDSPTNSHSTGQPNLYYQQYAATPQEIPPAQPQATDSFATNPTDIKIVSQNVQGLENEEKLEYLARIITKHNIQAYLIQETHLAGDFTMQISGGHTIIHHGPEAQPTNGAKGGVAIILCPEWY
jgi:hypothetical protein